MSKAEVLAPGAVHPLPCEQCCDLRSRSGASASSALESIDAERTSPYEENSSAEEHSRLCDGQNSTSSDPNLDCDSSTCCKSQNFSCEETSTCNESLSTRSEGSNCLDSCGIPLQAQPLVSLSLTAGTPDLRETAPGKNNGYSTEMNERICRDQKSNDCREFSQEGDELACSLDKPTELLCSLASIEPEEGFSGPLEEIESYLSRCPRSIDKPSAARLAARLYSLDGFKRWDVCRQLAKKNDFNELVAEQYFLLYDFADLPLDQALRTFCARCQLSGESQDRERVLFSFSSRYIVCNPSSFSSLGSCNSLVCALVQLNTELHSESQNAKRKVTCNEFASNLANSGVSLSRERLKALYTAVKECCLHSSPSVARETNGVCNGEDGGQLGLVDENDSSTSLLPLSHSLPDALLSEGCDENNAKEYHSGFIMRKSLLEPGGRRTSLGRRGWRVHFASLRGLTLQLHKRRGEEVGATLQLHHALAAAACDYRKKQHVLRLRTADWAECLLQAGSKEDLQKWVDNINLAAASLSVPTLHCPADGDNFKRPLLPAAYTKLSFLEQLQQLEQGLLQLEQELVVVRAQNTVQQKIQTARLTYLQGEVQRYDVYVRMMRAVRAAHPELEPSLVESVIGEVDEDTPSPARSHSPLVLLSS